MARNKILEEHILTFIIENECREVITSDIETLVKPSNQKLRLEMANAIKRLVTAGKITRKFDGMKYILKSVK